MKDCLFCKIVNGEIPATVEGDTENCLAFKDIAPVAPTHLLVIPKAHIASLQELGPGQGELLEEMFGLLASLADSSGLGDGYRVVTNVGSEAGQTVPHLHFHLLGGRSLGWPPG